MQQCLRSRLLLLSAMVALAAISQSPARADEVTVSGSSTGMVTGVPDLSFTGNVFTATTALGAGAFSGTNNFGSFSLTPDTTQSLNGTFTLNLALTAPSGING